MSEKTTRFSIVTTCRNAAHFLPQCLASVEAQLGVEVEHIITDSASTDGTVELLRQHPRLQWTSEPDGGMSEGINKGFRRATGDWLMWLNADDYLLPGALAKVADFAARHPEADVIYGDHHAVREDGSLLRVRREHRFDAGVLLFHGCYIASTACFYRREVIAAGQLLDESLRVCMDFDYYLRLMRAGYRFGYLPEVLACFRWHATNTSMVQSVRRHQERLSVQREHLALTGRSSLSGERLLYFLYTLHRFKRLWLKIFAHREDVSAPFQLPPRAGHDR